MFNTIIKCTQYDLMNTKAKIGQIYYVTDARVLYKDTGPNIEQRLRFNAIILHNDAERLNRIKPTIGKFYYIEETNSLWLFDTRWVLKIGNTVAYNTYYAGDYVSPVINTDTSISGPYGDKIIDNNGLLGDGSVVIRDVNRLAQGIEKANLTHQRLEFASYLDDGFLFIPNAHLPYTNLSQSLGALHLTVEKNDVNNATSLKLNGNAHYYGTWNNYGNMYLIQKNTKKDIAPNYVPENDYEIVKFYITSTKETPNGLITTHIVLRPISDSKAIFHIISVLNENTQSVVQNDMGELIYTGDGSMLDNVSYECTRKIITNDVNCTCKYILETHGETITMSRAKNSTLYVTTLSDKWADKDKEIITTSDIWYKDKVLTYQDMVEFMKSYKQPDILN